MNWIEIIENDSHSYPKEGYPVLVTDGDKNYDTVYYLASDEEWLKMSVLEDETEVFEDFEIIKWSYIENEDLVSTITQEEIRNEAIKRSKELDFSNNKSLNEKGRERVREWSVDDFIAGANFVLNKFGMDDEDSSSIFDAKIEEWHNSESYLDLYEYLGLTLDQYKKWLKNPELIEKNFKKFI